MAAKKPVGARNETVQCENCGEYYAVTYKRCPFCEERAADRRRRRDDEYEEYDDDYDEYDDYEDDSIFPRKSGGKHLVTNGRGGGYGRGPSPWRIVWIVFSLALIAAAVWVIIMVVKPFIDNGKTGPVPPASTPPTMSMSPSPSVRPSDSAAPQPSDTLAPTASPGVSPSPGASQVPAGQTATGFSLVNYAGKTVQDISLNDNYPDFTFRVVFTPSGSTGTITWESSKPGVVAVDQNGKLTPVSKGTATITATLAGGYQETCIVRNNVSGGGSTASSQPPASAAPSVSPAPSTSTTPTALSLNHTDFTFSSANDTPVTMKVTGTSSAVTWSVKDSSIATIDGSGKVRPVAPGRTTIFASVDGQTLECIVRCSW